MRPCSSLTSRSFVLLPRALALALTVAATAAGTIALAGAVLPPPSAASGDAVPLAISRIYWEYNASANDLGVHVFLDGEDWRKLTIVNPKKKPIFQVVGKGPYHTFGMTELFFEGAEPSLEEVPLAELLAKFPEGEYDFRGKTADGEKLTGTGVLSHAIPDGPIVSAEVGPNDYLRIDWTAVSSPPKGFPLRPIHISGYQVIVESFQVTVPASVLSLTVSPEFVATLGPGEHLYEVLAIEENGNQTLTEGSFVK